VGVEMKYVLLIGDGMADYPIAEHGGKTALQIANTPNLDFIAAEGICGVVKTIPEEMGAGSDIATLSILGYDPARYYTGRGPLEAMGMRVPLNRGDVALRCNLITEKAGIIEDYSGGHITNEEAKVLIEVLDAELREEGVAFYPGVSYRNVMVLKSESVRRSEREVGGAPPHDIIGARVEEKLPADALLRHIIRASKKILDAQEINKRRAANNQRKANMVWLWSGGRKPQMPEFRERYGVSGAVISGVYLVKGVGRCVGLDAIDVPGATGYIDTNYEGKAEYALRSLKDKDFILVHVEAPDEAAHIGDIELKVKAIEDFDARVVGTVLQGLEDEFADVGYRVLAMPDHYTPVSLKVHTKEAVPFAMYQSQHEWNSEEKGDNKAFDELSAKEGLHVETMGLMPLFFRKHFSFS
jgi:2,3-bisphosphoglycerate-independent phosphoglycerate mutase